VEHGPVEPARLDPSKTVGSFRTGRVGSSLAVRGLQPIVEANRWLSSLGLSGARGASERYCRGYRYVLKELLRKPGTGAKRPQARNLEVGGGRAPRAGGNGPYGMPGRRPGNLVRCGSGGGLRLRYRTLPYANSSSRLHAHEGFKPSTSIWGVGR